MAPPRMLLLALMVPCVAAAQRAPAPHQPERMNVVLIMADDLGYGELGCYGQQKIKTPHIDALAKEGVRFTQAYSPSPVCAPTRASLMTGKHQGHAAIRGNKEVGGWGLNEGEGNAPLPDSEKTMAEWFKQSGYATGAFGKWGLGGPGSEGHPLKQGFDSFFGYLCQRQAHNYYPTHLWNGNDVWILTKNDYFNAHQKLDAVPSDPAVFDQYKGGQYSIDEIDEHALAFIESNKSKRFFLYVPSTIPHAALQVTQPWVDMYPVAWDPAPYLGDRGYVPVLRPRATYAGMISRLDHTVGQIVSKLKEEGLLEKTLIIFTSDNGATFNGGVDREFFASNGDLRGFKTQMWEGGIRVPMIVRMPKGGAARTEDYPTALYDLLPTLTEACGLGNATGIDGASIWPIIEDRAETTPRPYLYWEYPEGVSWRAVRRGDFKAIQPNLKAGSPTELYNLRTDPRETKNLAAENEGLVRDLERIMQLEHRPNVEFPLPGVDTPTR